ncbi:MAG: transglycosylase SLT domain-containing protein [Deltaproteobacteria bacterium]|nr:transglycosylase SLT domain-containing protein [Deltaproteobacteria bacterium]
MGRAAPSASAPPPSAKPPATASSAKPAPSASPKASASAKAPTAKPAASVAPKSAKPAAPAKPEPAKAEPPAPKTPKPIASPFKPGLTPSPGAQKAIAGAPSPSEAAAGPESPELRAMREAEIDLFAPGAAPALGSPWPSDLPSAPKGPLAASGSGGLPPAPVGAPAPPAAVGGKSLAWLGTLKMPDIPVRWDARVVKYLEFFRDDARGRKILAVWWKRSGRYRELIQESLRARSMPEDLAWVAMVESGFDPTIKSPAGASGLWQFMPDAARIYGLSVDRWADGRHSPLRATAAAIAYLADLKKRFGTWELALAAYNMGYGGALATVKRFNSNDYWELSRYENGLPWETTLYVPKIIAMAVVSRNPQVFGLDAIVPEASLKGDPVDVPAGTELKAVSQVAGCTLKELESLNPELRAGRTPPALEKKELVAKDEALYTILVPTGKSGAVKDATAKLAPKGSALEKYVVRFGETLDQIASARKITRQKLVELNGIAKDEAVRGGTVLLVPQVAGLSAPTSPYAAPDASKPIALVPGVAFAFPDRQRLFYRVIVGDTPREIADAFGVSVDELKTWNAIEPTARLQEGMTLQVFATKSSDLSRVVFMKEGEVKILAVGSDEFYDHEEAANGRKRATVLAAGGETLEQLGKKHGLSPAKMEKINRRPRSDVLAKGEAVIVYVPMAKAPASAPAPATPAPVAGDGDLPALPASVSTSATEEAKPEASE